MALLATSDQVSNTQAHDFATLARAANKDGMVEQLLGLQDAPASQSGGGVRTPSAGEALPGSGAFGTGAGAAPEPPPVSDQPHQQPERSPDRQTRDELWREGGPGVNPQQD
jgi:hypothetical protein